MDNVIGTEFDCTPPPPQKKITQNGKSEKKKYHAQWFVGKKTKTKNSEMYYCIYNCLYNESCSGLNDFLNLWSYESLCKKVLLGTKTPDCFIYSRVAGNVIVPMGNIWMTARAIITLSTATSFISTLVNFIILKYALLGQ